MPANPSIIPETAAARNAVFFMARDSAPVRTRPQDPFTDVNTSTCLAECRHVETIGIERCWTGADPCFEVRCELVRNIHSPELRQQNRLDASLKEQIGAN